MNTGFWLCIKSCPKCFSWIVPKDRHFIIPVLPTGKLRHRLIKSLSQTHNSIVFLKNGMAYILILDPHCTTVSTFFNYFLLGPFYSICHSRLPVGLFDT